MAGLLLSRRERCRAVVGWTHEDTHEPSGAVVTSSWNVRMVHALRCSLDSAKKRDSVIKVVREWWDLPENKGARERTETAEVSAVNTLAFAASFDDMRSHVVERATSSSTAWDGLRQWAHAEVAAGRQPPLDVLAVLLRQKGRPAPRGRRKGQAPWKHNTDQQLAFVVAALVGLTSYKTLDAGKATELSEDSPFCVIHKATGQPAGAARKAWQANFAHKKSGRKK